MSEPRLSSSATHTTGSGRSTLSPLQAERRQLKVMFADLVGSTQLSTLFDPEDLREVLGRYQAEVTAIVERFGGYVARFLGDGLLAYFGWPRASDADAERAVRAALAVLDAVGRVEVDGQELRVRIGIATGLVVVGDIGPAQEHAAVGETPNLAARLQGAAEPNCIVISEATRAQLGDLFILESPIGNQETPRL